MVYIMRPVEQRRMRLLEVARQQGGFFAAYQAAAIGYDNANQFLFVRDGRWERVRRGVFRLASEPRGEFDDLYALSLFFRHRDGTPSGVFGLETAAAVHGLGDYMLRRIVVLVRPRFRKNAQIPDEVELNTTSDLETQCDDVSGLRVTSPLRTVADLLMAPQRDREEIRRAFAAGRRQGLISPDQVRGAKDWAPSDVTLTIRSWETGLKAKVTRGRR